MDSQNWKINAEYTEANHVTQLPKNFPKFYGIGKFITVFTRAHHWLLSWARLIQSMPPHPISLRSILILSSYLWLGLHNRLFVSCSLTKTRYTFFFASICAAFPAHLSLLDLIYIWWRVQVMMFLIMQFFLTFCYFISLRPKHSLQKPVLRYSSLNVRNQVLRSRYTSRNMIIIWI
jgi:hypothetical protein